MGGVGTVIIQAGRALSNRYRAIVEDDGCDAVTLEADGAGKYSGIQVPNASLFDTTFDLYRYLNTFNSPGKVQATNELG